MRDRTGALTRNELATLSEIFGPQFDAGGLTVVGPPQGLASPFDVTALATSSIAAAHLAAAELMVARDGGQPRGVTVDRAQACAAFKSESLFKPQGWPRPTTDGRIDATYRCADGWIRLHASYDWHHTAALDALGLRGDVDKTMVAEVVAGWRGEDLESAVIAAGGCAALMRHARGVARTSGRCRLERAASGGEDHAWQRHGSVVAVAFPAAGGRSSAGSDQGHRGADLHEVPRRSRCTRTAHRPAGLPGDRWPAADHDGGQAPRSPRPALGGGRRDPGTTGCPVGRPGVRIAARRPGADRFRP